MSNTIENIQGKKDYYTAGKPQILTFITQDDTPMVLHFSVDDLVDNISLLFSPTIDPIHGNGTFEVDLSIFTQFYAQQTDAKSDTFTYQSTEADFYLGKIIKVRADNQQQEHILGKIVPFQNFGKERLAPIETTPFFVNYPQCISYINSPRTVLSAQHRAVSRIIDGFGIYLKWDNNWGGFSYWLFNDYHTIKHKIEHNIFYKNSHRQVVVAHKDSTKETTLYSICPVIGDELKEVQTLFYSHRVWLYHSLDDGSFEWLPVVVKNNKVEYNVNHTDIYDFSVEIEFLKA